MWWPGPVLDDEESRGFLQSPSFTFVRSRRFGFRLRMHHLAAGEVAQGSNGIQQQWKRISVSSGATFVL